MNDDLQSIIDQAVQQSTQNGTTMNDSLASYHSTNAVDWLNGFSAGMNTWWFWAINIVIIISNWVLFGKAGKPGWASIIPFYNVIVMLQIINRPWWWLLLLFVPIVNIVIGIMATYLLAKAFGKDGWFTVGMLFLPFVFYPVLAFGDAKYHKPA